jgi:hypothetical protein
MISTQDEGNRVNKELLKVESGMMEPDPGVRSWPGNEAVRVNGAGSKFIYWHAANGDAE